MRKSDIHVCAAGYAATVERYLDRLVDPWLTEVLAAAPAVMLTGARASGKTTTALRHASQPLRHFVSGLINGESPNLPSEPPDLRDYAEIALRGGFPEPAIELSGGIRDDWLRSYIEQMLAHDLPDSRIEAIPICALWS